MEEVDDLFQNNIGVIVFETNNPDYSGPRGYTLWALRGTENEPFTRKEVDVVKVRGNIYAGYGIVSCHGTTGSNESMLLVMINTQKEYMAGKVVNGDFQWIKEWTSFDKLSAGLGVSNKIVVTRTSSGVFAIELNDFDTGTRFQDETIPVRTGGREGYIAVISPNDDLVHTAVRIEYKE
jgi:hypothetical protein